jgi:hypothetical protein
MRLLTAIACALAMIAPASATVLDPTALVLRQADLPAGFGVDRHRSRSTPNASYTSPQRLRSLVEKWGRVTGYRRVFDHRDSNVKVVQSQVDLFGTAAGAGAMLAWVDAEQRRHNARRGVIQAYGREGAEVGEESWVYWSGYPGYYVLVAWRHDRVLGLISSWEVGREGTLKLARIQQRRMATALR